MAGIDDHGRTALVAAARGGGLSLLRLSRLLGRNDAYLQQFVMRGSPRRLPERERRVLADFLNIPESALGGPAMGVAVRRLDLAAAAGPGRVSDDDRLAGIEHFPPGLVARVAPGKSRLSMIAARGDSMLPTIADGDDILVDEDDCRVGRRPAIFVLRLDSVLLVKRLHLVGTELVVASDNPAAAAIPPIPAHRAEVVGRVVWLGRKL